VTQRRVITSGYNVDAPLGVTSTLITVPAAMRFIVTGLHCNALAGGNTFLTTGGGVVLWSWNGPGFFFTQWGTPENPLAESQIGSDLEIINATGSNQNWTVRGYFERSGN